MGGDVDFYDRGAVADPRLIEALRALEDPPTDPEALALAIGHRCGHDIMFKLYQHHKGYAALRRRTKDRLEGLRKYASLLLSDSQENAEIYPFALTVDDLLADRASFEVRQRLQRELMAAVQTLACLPLRDDLRTFRSRPKLDERVTEAVRAVAEYWVSVEGTPFGGGIDRQAGSSVMGVTRGSAASLTQGALSALGINCSAAQLETHMAKVKEGRAT